VSAAAGKRAHILRRIPAEYLRHTSTFIEIAFEPFEDAGDLNSFLVRQKPVQVLAHEPGAERRRVLLLKIFRGVDAALQGRTTSRRAHQYRMRAPADHRPQG